MQINQETNFLQFNNYDKRAINLPTSPKPNLGNLWLTQQHAMFDT